MERRKVVLRLFFSTFIESKFQIVRANRHARSIVIIIISTNDSIPFNVSLAWPTRRENSFFGTIEHRWITGSSRDAWGTRLVVSQSRRFCAVAAETPSSLSLPIFGNAISKRIHTNTFIRERVRNKSESHSYFGYLIHELFFLFLSLSLFFFFSSRRTVTNALSLSFSLRLKESPSPFNRITLYHASNGDDHRFHVCHVCPGERNIR